MEDVPVASLPPVTIGRMLLSRLDQESAKAITAAVDAELRAELREEVVEQVRAEERAQARADLEEQRRRWRDEVDREKEEVWVEIEDRVEAGVQKARTTMKEDYLDDIKDLTAEVDALITERDVMEEALLAILQELLPSDKFVYLRNCGIKHIDLSPGGGIGTMLQKRGLRIRTRLTPS
jgi:hypothetical protein